MSSSLKIPAFVPEIKKISLLIFVREVRDLRIPWSSVTKSSKFLAVRWPSFIANAMSKQIDVTVPDSETLSSEKSKRFTVRSIILFVALLSTKSTS